MKLMAQVRAMRIDFARESFSAGREADEWDDLRGWTSNYTFEDWLKKKL